MVEEAVEVEDRRCRFLVRLTGAPTEAVEAALAALAAADRLAGLIAPGTPELAACAAALPTALLAADGDTAADGVVVDARTEAADAVGTARRRGRDAILLADVGVSRHEAMEAGEAGADALLFIGEPAAVRDCVAWWSELFVLPVAAPASSDRLDDLVVAGADFLVIEAAPLVDPARPLDGLLERVAAAEARRPTPPPPD